MMACRIPHDVPGLLAGLAPSPETHALAMPREARGEIDNVLLESHRLPGMRMLRIYVPAEQFRGQQPLPVLLVNDGHKVFEPANHASVPAWQQTGTLQLHRVMDGLLCKGEVRPAVVVAIATHSGSRADQYVPLRTNLGDVQFGGLGDAYLDLLEHEVLPAVQRRLGNVRLAEGAANRVLVGSSIGALSALYGVGDGFLLRHVQANGQVEGRIAADIGDAERAPIREHCRQLFEVLAARGGHRVLATEVGGMHNEDSWRARLPRLLQHVLGTVV